MPVINTRAQKSNMKKKETDSNLIVEGFTISGMLKTSLSSLAALLSKQNSLEVAKEKNSVSVAYVESRDIKGDPYSFIISRIYKDHIDVIYTIPNNISPRKRRIDVIHIVSNIIILSKGHYSVDEYVLLELLDYSVDRLLSGLDKTYSQMYVAYDHISKKYEDLERRMHRLKEENDALSIQNFELKSKNEELQLKLSSYEKISDEMLKVKLLDWIKDHDGVIDIGDFSRSYNVVEHRIESALNELLNQGYIRRIA